MTMHRIQMVWGEKGLERQQVLQRSVCLCVRELPEVAVCVVVLGGVQALS